MDTWSSAEKSHSGDSLCPLCHGTGFTHPLMASGEPDNSEIYPCPCSDRYQPIVIDETGDTLNLFWKEGKRQ